MPSNEPEALYIETLLGRLLEPRLGYLLSPWPRALHLLINSLANDAQTDPSALLRALVRDPRDPRIGQIVAAATIPHTAFYRHPDHFDRLRERLLELTNVERNPVQIWSAGCATGEEAYSIALVAESIGVPVEILATDISVKAIEKATLGRYERGPVGGRKAKPWQAAEELRRRIEFASASLVSPNPTLGRGPFDLIFCRNVLIYFTPEMVQQVQRMLIGHLKRNGELVVSPVESVIRIPEEFCREETLGWFRRKARSEPSQRPSPYPSLRPAASSRPPPPPSSGPTTLRFPSQESAGSTLPPRANAVPEQVRRKRVEPSLERAAQLLQAANPDLAEDVLRQLLSATPKRPEAWFLLGEALLARGERRQASVAFRQAALNASESSGAIEGATLASAALRRARSIDDTI